MKTFHVKKAVKNLVLPHEVGNVLIAVKDDVYDKIPFIDREDELRSKVSAYSCSPSICFIYSVSPLAVRILICVAILSNDT